jgi:hypothetical protein
MHAPRNKFSMHKCFYVLVKDPKTGESTWWPWSFHAALGFKKREAKP